MINKENIGKELILFMVENDLTVEEVAKQVKSSAASVYRWMNGKNMTNQNYIRLQKYMENYNKTQN